MPVAHSSVASLLRRWWAFLAARARPGSVLGAIGGVSRSVKRGGLPEERGEFARDGDRDHAGALFAFGVQVLPALVEPPLGAPGDFDHARVLAVLAAGELLADARRPAVVMGGFDQQRAGVPRARPW